MQFLELSENRLEILPAEMGNLTELRDCYLSENLLMDLPETFGKELSSVFTFVTGPAKINHVSGKNCQFLRLCAIIT